MPGVRIEVVRGDAAENDGSFVYRGFAETDEGAIDLEMIASASGVTVRANPRESIDLERRARVEKLAGALVRAATRAELTEGTPPPRKIVRWRSLEGPA